MEATASMGTPSRMMPEAIPDTAELLQVVGGGVCEAASVSSRSRAKTLRFCDINN